MSNPLQNLKIDYWYKAILVLGSVALILALTVDLKGIENIVALKFSLSAIFIGIGEWINHPLKTITYPANFQFQNGLQYEGYVRSNSFLGLFFVISGIAIAGYQAFLLLH